jgi:carboxypeptidase M
MFMCSVHVVWFELTACVQFEHHNYESTTKILQSYASLYPNKTHLYSIGRSVEGRELWVMAISHVKPGEQVLLRPESKFIANMHGHEAVGRELLLHLIDYLLTRQGQDSDVDYLLRNTRIHIMPAMNPDGYERASVGCSSLNGRLNANGFDLNRNFPDLFDCGSRSTSVLQPETSHVMKWLDNNQFILSANFHTGAVVLNYPFDNYFNSSVLNIARASPTADDDLFVFISRIYSSKNSAMQMNPCGDQFSNGITNGGRQLS